MLNIIINDLVKNKEPYNIPKDEKDSINLITNQNYISHKFSNNHYINIYPVVDNNYTELVNKLCIYNNCKNNNILLTNGSGAALQLILKTFCNLDTKILIPIPNYPGFIHDAKLSSFNVNLIKCHKINDDFIYHIKYNDIIYISNPNIPIGYTIDVDFIEIIKLYPNKLFIIDEAYFEYSKLKSFWNNNTKKLLNLIIVRTFSKAFGAAGIRLGYLITNKKLINFLKIPYCTKSVPNFSINYGLKIINNLDYYLKQVNIDLDNWNALYEKIKKLCNEKNNITDIQYSKRTPFFLLYCKNADYVCKIMKHNKLLIRNKTNDLEKECVRVSLSNIKYMNMIYNVIKKLNFIDINEIENIYFDIDITIRESPNKLIDSRIINHINNLSKTKNIKFITNNRDNYDIIEKYLYDNLLTVYDLITPLKYNNIILSKNEIKNGYCLRNNNIYIFSYPIISYDLMKIINEKKEIYIIEDSDYEYGHELGHLENIKIPFIGCFLKLLTNIKINYIGKNNIILENNNNTIMIGDSIDDFKFAYNNNMYFKQVNNTNDTILFLDLIDN